MQDRLRNLGQYKPTRRDLLIGVSVAAAASLLNRCYLDSQPQPTPTPSPTPDLAKKTEKTMDELLQEILDLPPHTEKRVRLELEYLGNVAKNLTLQNIDRGFWVTTNPSARAQLLERRWALRNEGRDGLKPIPEDKLGWAIKQGIHPEILAISLDAYEDARDIVNALNKSGRLRDDGITFEDLDEPMMNPGGMARLIHYETRDVHHFSPYAFTHIGDGIALNEIRNSGFSDESKKILENALIDLCNAVSVDTKLRFHPDKIPGSERGNPEENIGGGAISIQFMPDNALRVYKLVKEVTGRKLNVFDLRDATIMAWVFLALHRRAENLIGYRKSSPVDQANALFKWNRDRKILVVRDVAVDYFQKFLDKSLEKVYPY